MADINIDTSEIRDIANRINTEASKYEGKTSFFSGATLVGPLVSKVPEIRTICENIAANYKKIGRYTSVYLYAFERIEKKVKEEEGYIIPPIMLQLPSGYRGKNTLDNPSVDENGKYTSPFDYYRDKLGLDNMAILDFLLDEREWDEKFNELVDNLPDDTPIIVDIQEYYGLQNVSASELKEIIKGNKNISDFSHLFNVSTSSIGSELLKNGFDKKDIIDIMAERKTIEEVFNDMCSDTDRTRINNWLIANNKEMYNDLKNVKDENGNDKFTHDDIINLITASYDPDIKGEIDILMSETHMTEIEAYTQLYDYCNRGELKSEQNDKKEELNNVSDGIDKINHQRSILSKWGNLSDIYTAAQNEVLYYKDADGNIHDTWYSAYSANQVVVGYESNSGAEICEQKGPVEKVTYWDVYGNDEFIQSIANESKTSTNIFGRTRYIYSSSDSLDFYNNKFRELNSDLLNLTTMKNNLTNDIKSLDDQIDEISSILSSREKLAIQRFENSEYLNLDGFDENNGYIPHTETIDTLREDARRRYQNSNSNYAIERIYLNTDEEIAAVVNLIINEGEDSIKNDTISGRVFDRIEPNLYLMTDDEKSIFNYIYNTEGATAAVNYLYDPDEGILYTRLDDRWLEDHLSKDREWASQNFWTGLAASTYSVFVTPVEGMVAAIKSNVDLANGDKILRSEVYSVGDVYRQTCSEEVHEINSTLGFFYDTGMSMADTALYIGVSALAGVATGGVGLVGGLALSAAMMGSRVYVSTLNNALDRGLSDEAAVLTAWLATGVETVMEYASFGHLVGLEKGSTGLIKEALKGIDNPTLAKAVNYVGSAISQAIMEGDEEFCTEYANYYIDKWINGEKSEYQVRYNELISEGVSEEEAKAVIENEIWERAEMAWLGGAVSGLFFGAGSAVNTTQVGSMYAEYQLNNNSNNTLNYGEAFAAGLSFSETLAKNGVSLKSLLENGFSLDTNITINGENMSLGAYIASQIEESGNKTKYQEFMTKLIPSLNNTYERQSEEMKEALNNFKENVLNNENSQRYNEIMQRITNTEDFKGNFFELLNNNTVQDGTLDEKITNVNEILSNGGQFVILRIDNINELNGEIIDSVQDKGKVIVELKDGSKFLLSDIKVTDLSNITLEEALERRNELQNKLDEMLKDSEIGEITVEDGKYSLYLYEQLSDSKTYTTICDILLELAPDNKTRQAMQDIIYNGGYDGFSISSNISNKDNPTIDETRRISMAYMLLTHPGTFYSLVKNKVNVFHGTNSSILKSVLENGLKSGKALENSGVNVETGEAWSRYNGQQRNWISFTDIFSVAEGYSEQNTTSIDGSFGVVFGTTVEEAQKAGLTYVRSDIVEIGVKNDVSVDAIKVIIVPESKVDYVRELVGDLDIEVLAMDESSTKFYSDADGILSLYNNSAETFKEEWINNHPIQTIEEIQGEINNINRIIDELEKLK